MSNYEPLIKLKWRAQIWCQQIPTFTKILNNKNSKKEAKLLD